MTESEFLERIDRHVAETTRHIAETKEHIAETKEHIAETNRHMARGNELFDRCIRATDDLRQFIREMTLRSERFHRELLAELAAGRRELLAELAAGRRELLTQRHELGELRADSRAQTEALMRMIERLPPRTDS